MLQTTADPHRWHQPSRGDRACHHSRPWPMGPPPMQLTRDSHMQNLPQHPSCMHLHSVAWPPGCIQLFAVCPGAVACGRGWGWYNMQYRRYSRQYMRYSRQYMWYSRQYMCYSSTHAAQLTAPVPEWVQWVMSMRALCPLPLRCEWGGAGG